MTSDEFEFDFVISYAGEDTEIATKLKAALPDARVFFAPDNQAEIWGKNLYEYLNTIYGKKGRYCIPLISQYYVSKVWTRHEWKSAQERALQDSNTREYILPIRLDDTDLPGLLSTTAYLDIRQNTMEEIGAIALQKLRAYRTIKQVPISPQRKQEAKYSISAPNKMNLLTPEAKQWAKRLVQYWSEGKIEQLFNVMEVFAMGNSHHMIYGHGILDDEVRKSEDKPSIAILQELASSKLVIMKRQSARPPTQSWNVTLTENLKQAVAFDFKPTTTNLESTPTSDYTDAHRNADLRLLNEFWEYINSSRLNYIMDQIDNRNMKFDYYQKYIYGYTAKRELPENQFINIDLETAFQNFDEKLIELRLQISTYSDVETKEGQDFLVPHYKIVEREHPSDRSLFQMKLAAHKDSLIMMDKVRTAHRRLVQTIKQVMPEFQFTSSP